MKKRIVSIILSLVMLLSLLPVTAFAEATGITAVGGTLSAGDYVLNDDVELTNNLTVNVGKDNTVTIDLNGHVLKGPGPVIIVTSGNLILDDSAPATEHKGYVDAYGLWHWDKDGAHQIENGESEKTITGGVITGGNNRYGGGVYIDTNGTFTMKNGTISGNTANGGSPFGGGGVYIDTNGTFTMKNGTISGNVADNGGGVRNDGGIFTMENGIIEKNNVTYYGGGVYNDDNGTFTMKNGTISGNTASDMRGGGGGVWNYGTFTMENGTISGNTASGIYDGGGVCNNRGTFTMKNGIIKENNASIGGGVCNYQGTFTMENGIIEKNNVTYYGGGVCHAGVTLTLGGTAQITGNTTGAAGSNTANNLYLFDGMTITLGTGDDAPSAMSVGVTMDTPGSFTGETVDGNAKYFFSDSADYYVNFNNNNTPEVASDDYLELKAPAGGNYAINVIPSENGVVTASKKEAAGNDPVPVTLTVTPADGYQLKADSLLVKYNDGEEKSCELAGTGNTYTFTMPAYPVTVTAEFELAPAPVYSGGGESSYSITAESAENGTFTVDKKNASAGSTVTITVAPDKGFTLETLTVLDKNGKEIEVKSLGNDKYSFKMPSGKVSISATFMEDNTMLNFCVDVTASDYYYDAVLWAYENEICKGTDAVHFSPNAPVTRAQVVTFLWRAAGCPVVNYYMNMSDVKSGEYYSEAVRWALSEGITKGTSATTFSPDKVCTRAQIVTFLARFAGVADEATGYTHGFTDVNAADYFNNAVAWAKDNKVTEGATATTFSPNDDCIRAQVVTSLYRWMVK